MNTFTPESYLGLLVHTKAELDRGFLTSWDRYELLTRFPDELPASLKTQIRALLSVLSHDSNTACHLWADDLATLKKASLEIRLCEAGLLIEKVIEQMAEHAHSNG